MRSAQTIDIESSGAAGKAWFDGMQEARRGEGSIKEMSGEAG